MYHPDAAYATLRAEQAERWQEATQEYRARQASTTQHGPTMIEMLSLPELVHRCKEETARYRRREPYSDCYGFELFRRAVVHRDDDAWIAIFAQYGDVVRYWLRSAPDEGNEGVTAAFERFWRAVDAAQFGHFDSLAAVLQYLKRCALGVRIDRARAVHAHPYEVALDTVVDALPATEHLEESVAAQEDAARFWQVLDQCLTSERERVVFYLSYTMGLTPCEICARQSTHFSDVGEVYRIKRHMLDRLRRSPLVQALL
jgi:hypothetical protein